MTPSMAIIASVPWTTDQELCELNEWTDLSECYDYSVVGITDQERRFVDLSRMLNAHAVSRRKIGRERPI